LLTSALFSGCAVTPQPATQDEVRTRVQEDTAAMYLSQQPITAPLTLEQAIARTLTYNLDYRLKKMESALALGLSQQANMDMLPNLVASAGYRTRSNYSGGRSVGIFDGVESTRETSSEDRERMISGVEFSWNVLDFGVSYYRARQQADQVLIAEERRRKVVQNMVQDVRSAYWRALGAQRMSAQGNEVLQRANLALARSREAEAQRVVAPALALNYQRALLDAISLLNARRQDLEFAKRELAALMNLEPGVSFQIAEAEEAPLPAPPNHVDRLEEMALLQRPELREEDFKKRITAIEAKRQMASAMPSITFDTGLQSDTNSLSAFKEWSQNGVRFSWNLMRLASLHTLDRAKQQQESTDQARRMALSMAVLTQVRVGAERYRFAVEDHKLAELAASVDKRLADNTRASVTARLESELEAIRTQARSVLGAYQRVNAYANAQIAFGRLYNTLGFDPLPDNFGRDDLPRLAQRVRAHLDATEKEALSMSSQLFGYLPAITLQLTGADNDVQRVRLHAAATELLNRHHIQVQESGGLPMTLALQRVAGDSLQKATWVLTLAAPQGSPAKAMHAEHTVTLPAQTRDSNYEVALVGALTANLPTLRSWLNDRVVELSNASANAAVNADATTPAPTAERTPDALPVALKAQPGAQ
jgi:outer membrane protein TolC